MHQRQVVPSYLAYRRNQVVTRQLEARTDRYRAESLLRRAQINDQMRAARQWLHAVTAHSGYAFSGDGDSKSTAGSRDDRKGSKKLAWSTGDSRGERTDAGSVVTSRADDLKASPGTHVQGVSPDYVNSLRLRRSKSDVGVYPVMVPVYVVQQNRERARASGGALIRAKTDSSIRLPAKALQERKLALPVRGRDEGVGAQRNESESKRSPRKIKLKIKAKIPQPNLSKSMPTDALRQVGDVSKDTKSKGSVPVTRDIKAIKAIDGNQRRSLVLTDSNIADARRSKGPLTSKYERDIDTKEQSMTRTFGSHELPPNTRSCTNQCELSTNNGGLSIRVKSSTTKEPVVKQHAPEAEFDLTTSKIHIVGLDPQCKKISGVVQVPLRVDKQYTKAKVEETHLSRSNRIVIKRTAKPDKATKANSEDLQIQGETIKLEDTENPEPNTLEKQYEPDGTTKSKEVDNVQNQETDSAENSKRQFGLNKRYSIFLNAWHNLTSSHEGNNRMIGRPVTRPKFMLQKKFKRAVNLSIVSQRFRVTKPVLEPTPEEQEEQRMEEFRKSVQVIKYIRAVSAGKNTRYGEDEEVRMSSSQLRRQRKSLTEDRGKTNSENKVVPLKTTQNKELETKIKQFLTRP